MTEERFTPPREWCPNPEYWHSPDSEATETEVSQFIGSLVEMIKPNFVVETGTYHGHTTYEIAMALMMNGRGLVESIEKDGVFHEVAKHNLMVWGAPDPFYRLVHGNTMDYEPHQDIDFAFFDSWQEGRVLEFKRFKNLGRLKPGAIVAFHDTAPHHQVRKYIMELWQPGYANNPINFLDFHTPRGLILGQVI